MNSMLQQFYSVPTLRYCLLAADDRQPDNILSMKAKMSMITSFIN